MQITDIRFHLPQHTEQRLLAYATITFDECFVVHDIRLLRRGDGILVVLPSKRFRYPCPQCSRKCDFDSQFCKHCGANFKAVVNETFSDIAHPINKEFRHYFDSTIIERFQALQGSQVSQDQG